jgi:hypothetical protein
MHFAPLERGSPFNNVPINISPLGGEGRISYAHFRNTTLVLLSEYRKMQGFYYSWPFLHCEKGFLQPGGRLLHGEKGFLQPGGRFLHRGKGFLQPGAGLLQGEKGFLQLGGGLLQGEKGFLHAIRAVSADWHRWSATRLGVSAGWRGFAAMRRRVSAGCPVNSAPLPALFPKLWAKAVE